MNQQQIKTLRASNLSAMLHLILPVFIVLISFQLLHSAFNIYRYCFAQLALAFFFFQCFILLHETGHYSFFKNRLLNKIAGHLFGFLSFIPFNSWVCIHNLHHKWTGFRDKDPTTEGTVSPHFGSFTKTLVNVCWRLWMPLFTIGYRIGNYWNVPKIKRHVSPEQLQPIYINMAFQTILYFLIFAFFGKMLLFYIGPAYFLSLMISDVFILSQHSHIEIPIAGQEEVKPIRYMEQLPYTRSIGFSKFIAEYLYFNFNLHEIHHAYPGLPAYHIHKVNLETPNKVPFLNYLKDAKKLSGIDFIFSTSSKKIGK